MTDGITVTPKTTTGDAPQGYNHDDITPIAGMLGLDTRSLADTDSKALDAIYKFVRGDAKEMTQVELLHKVRELENRLGMTSLG